MLPSKTFQSSIATPGRGFEPVRNGQPVLSSFAIETFEIVFGCVIILFIFGQQYKKAVAEGKNKKSKARRTRTA